MPFIMPQKVKFKHCDPAGIVFYPRYFEMINDCVELFFDDAVGMPFEEMHQKGGVPTAEIAVTFKAPSRHGDRLELVLRCTRLGRTSLGIETLARCGGEVRFVANSTLVMIDGKGRPTPWPGAIRTKLETFVSEDAT